jgi:hypothetical protein
MSDKIRAALDLAIRLLEREQREQRVLTALKGLRQLSE